MICQKCGNANPEEVIFCETEELSFALNHNLLRLIKNYLLYSNNVNVNIEDSEGNTPLTIAASKNNTEIVELLIEKGANVNVKDMYGTTPLLYAIENNNSEISKLLIEKNADINAFCDDAGSPLLEATSKNNTEIVKLLLERGANVNARSNNGWTPLLQAVSKNNAEIVKLLLGRGADVNVRFDIDGRTPIWSATADDNIAFSRLLTDKDAEPSLFSIKRGRDNKFEVTPLYRELTINDNKELVISVFDKESDVNPQDLRGTTPLIMAVLGNKEEIGILLLKNGADINMRDYNGNSALDYARDYSVGLSYTLLHAYVKQNPPKDLITACSEDNNNL